MAAIPAIITVNFNSVYAGPHRVCWRIGSSGPYDCSTIVNCTGGGAACSANINVTVDNETCDQVVFEGYVQAACEDINSLNGRIAFSQTFTPDPACKRYIFTCENAPVDSIVVTTPGSGYDPMNPPAVSLSGGGGAGATATANVGQGAILSEVLTIPGTGYTDGAYAAVPLLGGSGSGAQATIGISGGIINTVIISAPGTGYLTGEVLTPDTSVVGVPTTSAQITVTTDYGTIISFNVTNAGSGYSSNPAVTIDPPGAGVQAVGVSVLRDCPKFTLPDCDGAGPQGPDIPVGETLATCSSTGQPANPVPAQYSIAESGNCLCTCENVTVTNTAQGGGLQVWAVVCGGGAVSNTLDAGESVTVCVVTGSLSVLPLNDGVTWTIVNNGTCQGA